MLLSTVLCRGLVLRKAHAGSRELSFSPLFCSQEVEMFLTLLYLTAHKQLLNNFSLILLTIIKAPKDNSGHDITSVFMDPLSRHVTCTGSSLPKSQHCRVGGLQALSFKEEVCW